MFSQRREERNGDLHSRPVQCQLREGFEIIPNKASFKLDTTRRELPHTREGNSLFTVASTVCEILAAKLRNSAKRRANHFGYDHLLKNTLCKAAKQYAIR